jgi:hypothetical protein
MTLRDVAVKIGFKADTKQLDGVVSQLNSIKHQITALVAIQVVDRIAKLSEEFGSFAEHIHQAALSAGITTEAFQKMAFSATQSGVSGEEAGLAIARLSRHLYEARKGGVEAQKAFADAGFTPQQISGFRNGQDALEALSDRFKDIQDPIRKEALAMELLGRGGYRMIGWLSQGSKAMKTQGDEATKLGIVLKTWQVDALVKLEHAFLKVWAVLKSLGAVFTSYLATPLTLFINDMLKLFSVNKDVVHSGLEGWAEKVAYAFGFVSGVIEGLVKQTREFLNTKEWAETWAVFKEGVAILAKVSFGAAVATFTALAAAVRFLGEALDFTTDTIFQFINAFKGAPSTLGFGAFAQQLKQPNQAQDINSAISSAYGAPALASPGGGGVSGTYTLSITNNNVVPTKDVADHLADKQAQFIKEKTDAHRKSKPSRVN